MNKFFNAAAITALLFSVNAFAAEMKGEKVDPKELQEQEKKAQEDAETKDVLIATNGLTKKNRTREGGHQVIQNQGLVGAANGG